MTMNILFFNIIKHFNIYKIEPLILLYFYSKTIMKPIIVTQRHPTPVRYFVSKYEIEILKNQAKRKSRARERDTKYSQDLSDN